MKANQPTLLHSLEEWFAGDPRVAAPLTQVWRHRVTGHGRRVQYTVQTTTALNQYLQEQLGWPAVAQACRIERRAETRKTGQLACQVHYAITDLSPAQAAPQRLLHLWRHHWDIENRDHWVLDTVFAEDRATARKGSLPRTLTLLRQLAITLLRLAGHQGITQGRARLSANPALACSLVGLPLE